MALASRTGAPRLPRPRVAFWVALRGWRVATLSPHMVSVAMQGASQARGRDRGSRSRSDGAPPPHVTLVSSHPKAPLLRFPSQQQEFRGSGRANTQDRPHAAAGVVAVPRYCASKQWAAGCTSARGDPLSQRRPPAGASSREGKRSVRGVLPPTPTHADAGTPWLGSPCDTEGRGRP